MAISTTFPYIFGLLGFCANVYIFQAARSPRDNVVPNLAWLIPDRPTEKKEERAIGESQRLGRAYACPIAGHVLQGLETTTPATSVSIHADELSSIQDPVNINGSSSKDTAYNRTILSEVHGVERISTTTHMPYAAETQHDQCLRSHGSRGALLDQELQLQPKLWAQQQLKTFGNLAMHPTPWWKFAIALVLVVFLLVGLIGGWCRPKEKEKPHVLEAEDHHDDHHHEEVDAFNKHDQYVAQRASQRASQVQVPPSKVEPPIAETGSSKPPPPPLKHNEWLTPDECQEVGLPPLGRMMAANLKIPPWEWSDSVDGWSRLPFPWDPLQLQMILREKNICTRDDPTDFSMPSKLVEQFKFGRCIWKYKSPENRDEIERITPLMCIRVVAPDGRYLVRASRMVLKDDKLKPDERPQWPGRALGQPDDALEEAAHLIFDQTKIPKEILKFRVAEAALSEPRNCNMLTVQVRFFRHFVEGEVSGDVVNDATMSERLGLSAGGFSIKVGEKGECDNFEWWEPSKCAEKVPSGQIVHEHTEGQKGSSDEHVVLVTPWSVDAVERCLRNGKVNTAAVKSMRDEMAQNLEKDKYHLVHNVKHKDDRSHGDPSIALVADDGRSLFFAPRGKNATGYA